MDFQGEHQEAMTQHGQLTSELNSSLSLIMAAPQKAVDKDNADIRAHRKVTTRSKCYKQTTFLLNICIPFLPVLLENYLVSCSSYSKSPFPSQKSEQTDEQGPVRSCLTFLTLSPDWDNAMTSQAVQSRQVGTVLLPCHTHCCCIKADPWVFFTSLG